MLADNLRTVRETIASALTKRTEKKETGDTVCLVAVTKNHPAGKATANRASGQMAPDWASANQQSKAGGGTF